MRCSLSHVNEIKTLLESSDPSTCLPTYLYDAVSFYFVSDFLLSQPEETHLISSAGGLFTPDQVAANIVAGIKV